VPVPPNNQQRLMQCSAMLLWCMHARTSVPHMFRYSQLNALSARYASEWNDTMRTIRSGISSGWFGGRSTIHGDAISHKYSSSIGANANQQMAKQQQYCIKATVLHTFAESWLEHDYGSRSIAHYNHCHCCCALPLTLGLQHTNSRSDA
jgi:hypothetical protein